MDGVGGSTSIGTAFYLATDDGLVRRLLQPGVDGPAVWILICAVLITVAVYTIGKTRAKTLQHEPTAAELMSKFRDLHSRGELTDAEFRTIRTNLAAQLKEELNDNGETG